MVNKINHKQKVVVLDMDNTILTHRFIDCCAERFNFVQALALLRFLNKDTINLTVRIASLLKDKTADDLLDVANSIPVVEDTAEIVAELKKRNYIVGIISDSYQLVARFIAEKIGADFWMANELVLQDTLVNGEVLIPSYFHYSEDSLCRHQVCKTNALKYVCKRYETTLDHCIVVGDSDNDTCIIRHAGTGVAFCSNSEELTRIADVHIRERSFKSLLQHALQ